MFQPRLLLLALLLIAGPLLAARDDAFVPDAEPPTPKSVKEGKAWSEGVTPLPPWPSDADLIPFHVDGADQGFRYAIDGRNLAIGTDGVVRYTLVAESASGARNVSFEGLRCTPNGQFRIYAYGAASGFSPAPETDWQPINKGGADLYRYDLWRSYLCVPLKFAPRPRQDMLRALRQGRVAPLSNAGFMAE